MLFIKRCNVYLCIYVYCLLLFKVTPPLVQDWNKWEPNNMYKQVQ